MAADVSGESALPANVGEYDVLTVMSQLNHDMPLRLDLHLKNGQIVKLLVPPFVVREWRLLMNYRTAGEVSFTDSQLGRT